ncbi:MAG: hypothetical protein EOO61_01790 [Hymenobacter sp.]|nr:MAG: hypothetical protein EOO61_01790 [Hymenobacter sp.]
MIPIVKFHDEDCVSAHALYKALKLTTPPYAKWVELWLPDAEEARDYYHGSDVTPKRGTPYLEYFLRLKFAKELCEKRRKPEASIIAIFLSEHMQTDILTPSPALDMGKDQELVVDSTHVDAEFTLTEEVVSVEPEAIVELVLKAQQACASFAERESTLNAQLAQLRVDWAAFIKQTNTKLGFAA